MKQRLNITLMDDSVLEVKKLRDMLQAETNYQISIAAVVKKLIKDALDSRNPNR